MVFDRCELVIQQHSTIVILISTLRARVPGPYRHEILHFTVGLERSMVSVGDLAPGAPNVRHAQVEPTVTSLKHDTLNRPGVGQSAQAQQS
ncbi:hypothetical protein PoB_007210700 [Plakobranchus ocellatus]|uniref:Uncharacterized protein n=1 Tax=Plakobranchus ocellatus TaxID=259542 RepID=A0AAV4DMR6_9GAST|nr:hypothetical protein PoB_007210700 [Plakobranchus ocellatus]